MPPGADDAGGGGRADSASRLVRSSPMEVFRAFAEPGAMERWIAPEGMDAAMHHFDFRPGGSYRMRLTYRDAGAGLGKSTGDTDEVEVRLVEIVEGERIRQEVVFASDDASFAGVMTMTWTFEPAREGTRVTVRAENVPAGIRREDHEAGMTSTLRKLDRFLRPSAPPPPSPPSPRSPRPRGASGPTEG